MIDHARRAATLLALAGVLVPACVGAQVRRGRDAPVDAGPWAPIAIGAQAGYDDNSRGEVMGAHATIPVVRSGRLQVVPSAEVTFLNQGRKEYQYAVDAIFMTAGREGGLYVGGGVGRRSSVIDGPRDTYLTYDLVAGVRSGVGVLHASFQLRWIFVQDIVSDFRPVPLTLALSFPLWGRRPGGS